ncbi:hypothetical protein [Ornithinimicrobium sp. LYQ103]|uniref:hypothetical protein n=1 Tax=Ornithinimicrobium sp. LYQ103 TaxID=3378796 RepID=UPI0038541A1B
MQRGIYEELLTAQLSQRLESLGDSVHLGAVAEADVPAVLSRHVYEVLRRRLSNIKSDEQRLALVNSVLQHLAVGDDEVLNPARHLLAVLDTRVPGLPGTTTTRPATPLSDAALLTNARGEPNLGAEVKAESGVHQSGVRRPRW